MRQRESEGERERRMTVFQKEMAAFLITDIWDLQLNCSQFCFSFFNL